MSKIRFNAAQPLDPKKYPTRLEKGREAPTPRRRTLDASDDVWQRGEDYFVLWVRDRGWEELLDKERYN